MPAGETVITIEARAFGQRKPLISDWQVPLSATPDSAGPLRLRDVLAHVVRSEVQAFTQRREERRLTRVLSPEQIQDAVAQGKVDMGGPREPSSGLRDAEVDEEAAVATALQGFEDGLYFVFLDEQQQLDLDAEVWLRPESTLTFIRLVALAGG